MVSPDTRNNLIVLSLIMAISIIVGSFIITFANNLEKTSREGMLTVQKAADNVTVASNKLVALNLQELVILEAGYSNLSKVLNHQLNVTLEERETAQENLGLFFTAFENQTNSMVAAIDEQKEAFTQSLDESQELREIGQNISEVNQNITEEQNNLLQLQIEQFDSFIGNITNNTG